MTEQSGAPGICVVGAGLVGLATALNLLERGHDVTVVDRGRPGHGASFGNAAVLASYAVMPIAQPGLWRRMPGLLFSPESPFQIRWTRLPRLTPWLLRFLRESSTRRTTDNALLLSQLLAPALEDWSRLLTALDAQALMVRHGCLHFYTRPDWQAGAAAELAMSERLGVRRQILDAEEVGCLEPALAGRTEGGVFFPDGAHVTDPLAVSAALEGAVKARGGRFVTAGVTAVRTRGVLPLLETDQGSMTAERVVIAAGAWSGNLARSVGDRVPLDTERGYHVEYPMETMPLTRPCCPVDLAFYMVPLQGRLRVAGTVELGSIDDAANENRLRFLRRGANSMLGRDLGEPSSHWLGFRPSMPDSVPVIGPSPRDPRVIYAFGHGHLGLTLAATTGRLVADMVAGDTPDWLAKCGADRFG